MGKLIGFSNCCFVIFIMFLPLDVFSSPTYPGYQQIIQCKGLKKAIRVAQKGVLKESPREKTARLVNRHVELLDEPTRKLFPKQAWSAALGKIVDEAYRSVKSANNSSDTVLLGACELLFQNQFETNIVQNALSCETYTRKYVSYINERNRGRSYQQMLDQGKRAFSVNENSARPNSEFNEFQAILKRVYSDSDPGKPGLPQRIYALCLDDQQR